MTSQYCASVEPTTNMLPCKLSGTFGAGACNTQVIFPKTTRKTHESLSEMLSRYPSFQRLPYSFSNLYPNLSAHLPALLPPFAMGSPDKSRVDSPDPASRNSGSKKDESQSLMDTNQSVPIPSKASSVRFGRLPSNEVTRKAPLMGTFRTLHPSPSKTGRKFPKSKQQRSVSRRQNPVPSENPIRERLRSAVVKRPGKQKRVVLYDKAEEEEDSDDEDDKEEEATATAKTQEIADSVNKEATENNEEPEDDGETEDALTSEESNKDSASSVGRHPKHDYEVPAELEGLRRALGSDSWNEYIYLVESLWLNKITAYEFERSSKPIFSTYDGRTRKKIYGVVTRMMIKPQLRETEVGQQAVV